MDLDLEDIRLQTFCNWPENAPVEASQLAKYGFHAIGNGLEVECHWCGLKLSEWEYGDQVMQIYAHKNIFFSITVQNIK